MFNRHILLQLWEQNHLKLELLFAFRVATALRRYLILQLVPTQNTYQMVLIHLPLYRELRCRLVIIRNEYFMEMLNHRHVLLHCWLLLMHFLLGLYRNRMVGIVCAVRVHQSHLGGITVVSFDIFLRLIFLLFIILLRLTFFLCNCTLSQEFVVFTIINEEIEEQSQYSKENECTIVYYCNAEQVMLKVFKELIDQ